MRIFTDDGDAIPVTVLDVSNNRVTQIKTPKVRRLQRHPSGVRFASKRRACPSLRRATWPRPASKPVNSSKNSASAPTWPASTSWRHRPCHAVRCGPEG